MLNLKTLFQFSTQVSDECGCDWTGNFGGSCAKPQTPGLSPCGIILCFDETETTYIECDAAVAESGCISDLALTGTKRGRFMTLLKNNNNEAFLQATGSESINENGGKDRNETIVGRGLMTPANECWLENMTGKTIIAIFEDNDGVTKVWGWDGGLSVTTWDYAEGQNSGDFKGLNFTMTNATRRLRKPFDFTKTGTYADLNALITYLTTP